MTQEVVEASVFWGGELFAVKYFAMDERVAFDDVPNVANVEVRTRVVDAAPKMPRNRWDLPLGALAITAACVNAMVVGSLGRREASPVRVTETVYATGDDLRVSSDDIATELSFIGMRGERADREDTRAGEGAGDEKPILDAPGDTGLLGLLAQYRGDGRVAVPWAPPTNASSGSEELWGDAIGEAWGAAGIGLSGVGEGGGGKAAGSIALRRISTISTGHGHGTLAGNHVGWVCRLPVTTAISCFRIAPEIIQRIVRQSEGRFRGCYAEGLRRNPSLAGRVVTKFVIARDGSVAAASDGGSDLPDDAVRACIARAFTSLEFPSSPDGIATVVYPIVLSPE